MKWDSLFSNIRWSTAITCADQIIALQEANLEVIVGETFADIDELEDIQELLAACKDAVKQNAAVETLVFIKEHFSGNLSMLLRR